MFARAIGAQIARFLNRPSTTYAPPTTNSLAALRAVIRPGDVLLVEGDRHISTAIKYLTQSTWSHAALCVAPSRATDPDAPVLIEADTTLKTKPVVRPALEVDPVFYVCGRDIAGNAE